MGRSPLNNSGRRTVVNLTAYSVERGYPISATQGLTLMELPPAGEKRWRAQKKAAVVRAIVDGTLSAADARERYMLSNEELTSWQTAYQENGIAGLLVKSSRHRRAS